MKNQREYRKKYFNLKALDVDETTKSVKVAIAEMETKDRDGDIIVPEAFNRTIKNKGPKGSNEIWHLLDHTPNSFSALSKFSELYVEGKYLVGISRYKQDLFAWREVAWPLYASGDFTQHSIGFSTVKAKQKDDYNEIQEIELWEGSAVLWGANPNTPTLDVRKSMLKDVDCPHCNKSTKNQESGMGYITCSNCNKTFNSQVVEYRELSSRLERLNKFILSTSDFEETKSLIQIEFKQIQQQLSDLENTTQPVEKTLDSVNEKDDLLDVITTFNKTLKERENGNKRITEAA
jgi:HK97 family phage prohead protease